MQLQAKAYTQKLNPAQIKGVNGKFRFPRNQTACPKSVVLSSAQATVKVGFLR